MVAPNVAATSQQSATNPQGMICHYEAPYSHLVDMPYMSPFIFEILTLAASMISLAMQLCNIYKTSWWLPYSSADYPLALEQIDYAAVALAFLLVNRRLFAFLCRLATRISLNCENQIIRKILLFGISTPIALYVCSVFFVFYILTQSYSMDRFGYMLFPVVTYMVLFGLNLQPLYQSGICGPNQLGYQLDHICSSVPTICRNECSDLASDFNNRLAHLFFESAATVFYATVTPLLFSGEDAVFYDQSWAGHVILLGYLSQLSLYCAFYLPCRYVVILQRCAAHLGHWKRLDSPIPASFWSDTQLWTSGAIVRHTGKVYRALCPFNAATPGHGLHNKFHALFSSPTRFYAVPLTCAVASLLYSLLQLLFYSHEWHQILGVGFLTLTNAASCFYLYRNQCILKWTSKELNESEENDMKLKEQ